MSFEHYPVLCTSHGHKTKHTKIMNECRTIAPSNHDIADIFVLHILLYFTPYNFSQG